MSSLFVYLSGFRVQFLNALAGLGNSSSRGMFVDSCYTHCRTDYQETWFSADSPVLDKTVRVMISSFSLVSFNILKYYRFPFLMIQNMFYAAYCKGGGRLVLRQESIPKDWLPLPLQPIARELLLNGPINVMYTHIKLQILCQSRTKFKSQDHWVVINELDWVRIKWIKSIWWIDQVNEIIKQRQPPHSTYVLGVYLQHNVYNVLVYCEISKKRWRNSFFLKFLPNVLIRLGVGIHTDVVCMKHAVKHVVRHCGSIWMVICDFIMTVLYL